MTKKKRHRKEAARAAKDRERAPNAIHWNSVPPDAPFLIFEPKTRAEVEALYERGTDNGRT